MNNTHIGSRVITEFNNMQLTNDLSDLDVGTELFLDKIGDNPCTYCPEVKEKSENKVKKYGFNKPAITPKGQEYSCCGNCPYSY
jgi:hypothetical protein